MSTVAYRFNGETGAFDEVGESPEYDAGYSDGATIAEEYAEKKFAAWLRSKRTVESIALANAVDDGELRRFKWEKDT